MFDDFEIIECGDKSYIIKTITVSGEPKEKRVPPGESLEWFLLNRIYRHKNCEQ